MSKNLNSSVFNKALVFTLFNLVICSISYSQSLGVYFVNVNYQTLQGEQVIIKQSIGESASSSLVGTSIQLTPVLSGAYAEPVTGIQRKFDEGIISVFPNPFTSSIRINTDIKNLHELLIVDAKGVIVQQLPYQKEKEINLSALNSGIYYISILDTSGNIVSTLKILKK